MHLRLLATALLCCALAAPALAQDSTIVVPAPPEPAGAPGYKAAHLNSGVILESLPASADADSLLRRYQDSLRTGLTALEQEFTEKLTYLQENQADITPKQSRELQTELQGLQESVTVYQQEAARMFEARRELYLSPIVDRVQAAIEAYAKTNGYTIVFDVSVPGAMVFAQESSDITEEVIAAMGEE